MSQENNEQAVSEVEKIIRDAITNPTVREQIEAVTKKHNENMSAVLIQSLSVFAFKVASASSSKGVHMATFIGGEKHFACIGENNMLVNENEKLQEGGQMLLAQVGEALGFTSMVEQELQEKAEKEPSINEQLVQEILAEEGIKLSGV